MFILLTVVLRWGLRILWPWGVAPWGELRLILRLILRRWLVEERLHLCWLVLQLNRVLELLLLLKVCLVLLLLEMHLLLLKLLKRERGSRGSSVCSLGGGKRRRWLPLSVRGRGGTSWL